MRDRFAARGAWLVPFLLVAMGVSAALPARAREGGLAAELPPPLPAQGCAPEARLRLAAAADLVRAAYLPPQPAKTATVGGLELTDDPRLLDVLQRMAGVKPPRSFAKARACQTVLCALTAALDSQESALWALVIAAEGGAVASLDQSRWKSGAESLWQPAELRALARAQLDLPPQLKHLGNLRAFRRIPQGDDIFGGSVAYSTWADPETDGRGSIWIKESVWGLPQRLVREVVAHESGHQYEYSRNHQDAYALSHSKEWLALSKWQRAGGDEKTGWRLGDGVDLGTNAMDPIPSEDFPDSIDNYRYQPRLLRAYSAAKYDYVKAIFGGREYLRPVSDSDAESLLRGMGGPLGAIRECAGMVQRAVRGDARSPQASLYAVHWKNGGGSQWANFFRSAFVMRSACFEVTMEKVSQQPGYAQATCRRDPEELGMAVAERLEEAWGALTEATVQIRAAAPRESGCLDKGNFTLACLAGPAGAAAADREARRLVSAYGANAADAPALARTLLNLTPLAPPDEAFVQLVSALDDPKELVTACLLGAVEVSTEPGKDNWRYWVKAPPAGKILGFGDPIWNAACGHSFAEALGKGSVTVDEQDGLFDHFLYLLRNKAGPPVDQFTGKVLHAWSSLRAACGIPAGTKASPGQRGCAKEWLKPRLDGIAGDDSEADALASHLAEQLRGP